MFKQKYSWQELQMASDNQMRRSYWDVLFDCFSSDDLIGMYYLNCIFFYAYFHDTDVRSLFYCTYWITGYFHRGPGWIHFKGLAW